MMSMAPKRPLATLLLVDVETTGIEFDENAPVEIGAVLFDVAHQAVTYQVSTLCQALVPNAAADVNRIPESLLCPPAVTQSLTSAAIGLFGQMAARADAVLAHNKEFDQQWLRPLISGEAATIPWLCTMRDFRWGRPGLRANPSLLDLALAHGVPVWAAHRALTDCTYLAQILAARDDLPALLDDAQTPQLLYQALVSYEEKDLAKAHGFQWQAHRQRAWTRHLREEEARDLPFRTALLDG